jgi:hypothetical protein
VPFLPQGGMIAMLKNALALRSGRAHVQSCWEIVS